MVSGTAWFSVTHISAFHFFRHLEPVQKFHLLDCQEKLYDTVWVKLNAAVHRELLPEFKPHQGVPFQTVLCCAELAWYSVEMGLH